MQMRYQRNLNHNYLIIEEMDKIETDYQLPMMLNNVIPGLLTCTMHNVDNHMQLYYEISSQYPLNQIFEKRKMSYIDLAELLKQIPIAFEKLDEYLLEPEHLIMEPEYIYINPTNHKIGFVFHPQYINVIPKSFHKVTEYLLDCVDYKDEKAVALAYELYKCTANDNYCIQDLLHEIVIHPVSNTEENNSESEKKENGNTLLFEQKEEHKTSSDIRKHDKILDKKYYNKNKDNNFGYKIGKSIQNKLSMFVKGILSPHEDEEEPMFLEQIIAQKEDQEIEIKQMAKSMDTNANEIETYGDTVYFSQENSSCKLIAEARNQFQDLELLWYPFIIGKLADAVDGMLQDECISRIHAKIDKIEDEYYIIDLNSTNGTYVNEKELCAHEQEQIHRGDVIKFGRVAYRFE